MRLGERGDDPGRHAQMAAGAHAVVHECDGFASLAEQPEEVREDGCGHVGAQLFELGLAIRGVSRERQQLLLSGEK